MPSQLIAPPMLAPLNPPDLLHSQAPCFLSTRRPAPPCPDRHVSPVLLPPVHQDCSCISHAQVQPLDIEDRYEDTSHQFLVSSRDTVSMETGVTPMRFHPFAAIHLSSVRICSSLALKLVENLTVEISTPNKLISTCKMSVVPL